MEDSFIDYRGNTLGAARDIRKRLKMAKAGHTINVVCTEDQTIRILREITFHDGIVISEETTEDGVFIAIRKT